MTGSCCANCGANIDTDMTYCEDCSKDKTFYFTVGGSLYAKDLDDATEKLNEIFKDKCSLMQIEQLEEDEEEE